MIASKSARRIVDLDQWVGSRVKGAVVVLELAVTLSIGCIHLAVDVDIRVPQMQIQTVAAAVMDAGGITAIVCITTRSIRST